MPSLLNRPCLHGPSCTTLTRDGYCSVHHPLHVRESSSNRPSHLTNLYSTHRWRNARTVYLANNRWCADPFSVHHSLIPTLATRVDHIVRHRGDMNLFWDISNWQPLCQPCHDRKTGTESPQYS